MKEIDLKTYRIEELTFQNKLPGPAKLELSYRYSYNVGYSEHNTCKGDFRAEISDKKLGDQFSLTITVSGVFATAAGAEKEVLHLKTYDALFPYVKALVSSITAAAGVPAIFIPYIDISQKNIYKVEMPKPGGNQ